MQSSCLYWDEGANSEWSVTCYTAVNVGYSGTRIPFVAAGDHTEYAGRCSKLLMAATVRNRNYHGLSPARHNAAPRYTVIFWSIPHITVCAAFFLWTDWYSWYKQPRSKLPRLALIMTMHIQHKRPDELPAFHYAPHLFDKHWGWQEETPNMPRSNYLCSNGEPVTFSVPSTVRDILLLPRPHDDAASVFLDFEPLNHADGVALTELCAASARPLQGASMFLDNSNVYD